MALAGYIKQGATVTVILGIFVDDTDGKTPETLLTILDTEVQLSKNGGALGSPNDANDCTGGTGGYYFKQLDGTDTNTLGILTVTVTESGALPIRQDYLVVTANWYDTMFSNDQLDVNVTNIEGSDATNQIRDSVVDDATRIDASVLNTLSSHDPGAELATVDNVWDEALTAATHNVPTSAGRRLRAIGQDATIIREGTIDAGSTPGTVVLDAGASGTNNFYDHMWIIITANTGAGQVRTIHNYVGATKTADVEDNWLTTPDNTSTYTIIAVGSMHVHSFTATAQAEIQSECNDALVAYDPPTKAELDAAVLNVSVDELQASALADMFNTNSGTTYAAAVAGSVVKETADNAGGSALTEAGIADAVWNEAAAGHVAAGSFGEEVQSHPTMADLNAAHGSGSWLQGGGGGTYYEPDIWTREEKEKVLGYVEVILSQLQSKSNSKAQQEDMKVMTAILKEMYNLINENISHNISDKELSNLIKSLKDNLKGHGELAGQLTKIIEAISELKKDILPLLPDDAIERMAKDGQ